MDMLSVQKMGGSLSSISISLLSILSRWMEIVASDSSKQGIEMNFNGVTRNFANTNAQCTFPSAFVIDRWETEPYAAMQNLRKQGTIWPQKGEEASGIAIISPRKTQKRTITVLELEPGGTCPPLLQFCPPGTLLTGQQLNLLNMDPCITCC